jgi:TusE/DsrC/DsvC family sulfur relay protein
MVYLKHRRWLSDSEGYLIDPDDWTEEIARSIAFSEYISMTDDHWKVVNFMRAWYAANGFTADVCVVTEYMAKILGYGNRAKARLYELFPYG